MSRAIALGFFDGVHKGHAALLEKAIERAGETGAVPSVLSFDVHPDTLVFNRPVSLITDTAGRKEIISRCFGIDDVVFLHFSKSVMRMPWEEFLESIISGLEVSWIVAGHDFTFGHRGEGNAERLREYCGERGIGCDIISPVYIEGQIVSSTCIRSFIEQGEMEKAALYLGHPHCLSDTVRSGFHVGRKMDAPTINMIFPKDVIVPKLGVYATKVILQEGSEHPAVTNVGVRPTFGEGNELSVESHLLDWSGNLYGLVARVDFYSYLRPEIKFEDMEALSEQIRNDTEKTREFFKTLQ